MEKRLLAVLFVIGMIVYAIVQILPFLLSVALLAGVIYIILKYYNSNREAYAIVGSYVLMPLLLLGWAYIGLLVYKNLYYHTYILTDSIEDTGIFDGDKIIAKTDEEAIAIAWEQALADHKDQIDNAEYRFDLGLHRKYIYNRTTDEIVRVYSHIDTFNSLKYNNGKFEINPDDMFW